MAKGDDAADKAAFLNIQLTAGDASADAPAADPVEDEIKKQEAEWIKYVQETQRGLSDKNDETAKTLIGLFATIFGAFTLLLAFFGLPASVNVAFPVALLAVVCFALSFVFLVWVIGPRGREEVNAYKPDEIWDMTARRNISDHHKLVAGIAFFIFGIFLVSGSIVYSSYCAGETVRIIAPQDKIPYLQNASIAFEANSTLSQEMQLIRQDAKTYTFLVGNDTKVTVTGDWVSAVVR